MGVASGNAQAVVHTLEVPLVGARQAIETEVEAHADETRRVLGAFEELRASPAKRILVVSSGGPISTILVEVLGMPWRGVVDLNLQTRNTGLTQLQAGASRTHFVSFNNVPHLDRADRAGTLTYA